MRPASGARRRAIHVLLLALVLPACGGATGLVSFAGPKIGFIFIGTRDDLGYNQAAWEASEAVARAFPDNFVLRAENVPESAAAEEAMETLIADGARIIFATSFGHLPFAANVARRHPDVTVLHQGGIEPRPGLPNLGTYWGTLYEPVYLAGIVAGRMTKTGELGYVVAFPIPATFNNVNAFTLGARSVNPDATTHVLFTNDWCAPGRQAAAARRLLSADVDVLTQHQDCTRTVLQAAESAGLFSIGYHYDGSEVARLGWLIGSVWDWRHLLIDIVRTVLEGRFRGSAYDGDYVGGLRTGDNPFVLTEFGPAVDAATRRLVAAAERRLRAGDSPFEGPIADREGRIRIPTGASPTYTDTLRMDYFVPGVAGEIPRR